jgi:hypothetical protein
VRWNNFVPKRFVRFRALFVRFHPFLFSFPEDRPSVCNLGAKPMLRHRDETTPVPAAPLAPRQAVEDVYFDAVAALFVDVFTAEQAQAAEAAPTLAADAGQAAAPQPAEGQRRRAAPRRRQQSGRRQRSRQRRKSTTRR